LTLKKNFCLYSHCFGLFFFWYNFTLDNEFSSNYLTKILHQASHLSQILCSVKKIENPFCGNKSWLVGMVPEGWFVLLSNIRAFKF